MLRSKPRQQLDAQLNVPPLGWTPDDDRRDEHLELSMLTALRKAK